VQLGVRELRQFGQNLGRAHGRTIIHLRTSFQPVFVSRAKRCSLDAETP
jgi:hypothetical protein